MEVFGKFELLTCLARGGMAEVFLARQRGDGRFERLVVIKRVLPHLAEDERFVELFLEEARIAALLDHPNIVPIYDLGRVDVLGADDDAPPSYFLAMPYIHGVTVLTLGHQSDAHQLRLSVAHTCTIMRQALAGLSYAFEHRGLDGLPLGVVHRDVTPSNLMINDQGRVQLLDFGIATVHDSDLATGSSRRGKVTYMSPEQVRSEELDCRSDLFSLAVIFWELLTYRRLFKADSDLATLRTITEGPYPDVLDEAPEVPEPIAAVVRGALQREREQRFASARSMREALDEAMRRCGIVSSVDALGARVRETVGDVLEERQSLVDRANAGVLSSEVPTQVEVPEPGRSPKSRDSRRSLGSLGSRGRRARRRRRWLLGAALALVVTGGGVTAALLLRTGERARPAGPAVKIGVTPYLPRAVLRRSMAPLLSYLERRVQRRFELVISDSYRHMMDALLAGRVDVADLTAYPYLLTKARDAKIRPLATAVTESSKTYESYLVVPRDSKAERIADMRGKRICYVDRTSTSGFLMPRVMVRSAGFDPDRFFGSAQFSGNHYRALRDLLAARCDVAAVTSGAYVSARRHDIPIARVRILKISPPIPHGVYCAGSHVPAALVTKLRSALLTLNVQRELGRKVLSDTLRFSGFDKVNEKAFRTLSAEMARSKRKR